MWRSKTPAIKRRKKMKMPENLTLKSKSKVLSIRQKKKAKYHRRKR